jgi:thiamine biosynthesis protein ThiI
MSPLWPFPPRRASGPGGAIIPAVQVVVHYAEVGLKGRNRPRFERCLARNLERALRDHAPAQVRRLYGRLLLELPDDASFEVVRRRLARVWGVAYFARASVVPPTLEAIEATVDALVDASTFETFGVRARRIDKRHPFKSSDLNRELGRRIQDRSGARVDLGDPDVWFEVHVLSNEAIVLHERFPGPGGMPVGSAGRVVSLISGGIDSPVASALALKRGCEVSFVHFHSAPHTTRASQDKVRELIGRIVGSAGPAQVFMVPFGELQQTLLREAPADPRIVLYRRFMVRIAERLAQRVGALALVTGESLGQVSSQTLGNLDTINRAATLPVLRPLIGMDKADIIGLAQELGTYEISIEPDEDCCSYLMPRNPATWTRPDELETIERGLDTKGLVESALEQVAEERIEPIHD